MTGEIAEEGWGPSGRDPGLLVARFSGPDEDGIGELQVLARANGFGGRGSAWFMASDVLQFAEQLSAFPLPDAPPEIVGGYGGTDSKQLPHETLRLEVRWISSRGQLAVRIHLATMVWPNNPPDPGGEATFEIFTTHEQLRQFGIELAQVARGKASVARLRGDRLA